MEKLGERHDYRFERFAHCNILLRKIKEAATQPPKTFIKTKLEILQLYYILIPMGCHKG